MRKLLFIIFLTINIFSSCIQDEAPKNTTDVLLDSANFTTIQWLDTTKDFGTVNQGGMITVEFDCKNTGNKPLYIVSAHPSCGCTLADFTKEPIKPGALGKVIAQFDTKKGHPGEIRKTITVKTNNSNLAPEYLVFTGILITSDSTNKQTNK